MIFYSRSMTQQATYWAPLGNTPSGGVEFAPPRIIACRWEDKAVLFRAANGREMTSRSVVYAPLAVERRGWLYLGDAMQHANPQDATGAAEVQNVFHSPALKGEQVLAKVML